MKTIEDFLVTAPNDNITVEVIDLYGKDIWHHQTTIINNVLRAFSPSDPETLPINLMDLY